MSGSEDAPLVDAFDELRKLVETHVADEAKKLLPKLAANATPEQIDGLGARIEQIKQCGS